MQLDKTPNTTAFLNRKEYLYFSGTSYLGVGALTDFQELVAKAIKKWGTSYGSSRNANIKLSIYEKAEIYLANFLNTETSVSVSSGTLAGHFTIKALKNLVDAFYFMPKTHPAILPENAFPIFENLEINKELKSIKNKKISILLDGIAAFETKPFSLNFLEEIDPSNTIYLVIDESHSLGILGDNGNGVSNLIPKKKNLKVIITSSLGKAFGINGGVIAGDLSFINLIKKDNLFIGCAGMSPAFLEVFLSAQEIYKKQLVKLKNNIDYVFEKLKGNSLISIDKSYPVFFHSDEKIEQILLDKNILITSFYYATSSKKFNRIVLNANHTKEQLDFLVNAINK
ncbi:aminotransferase class I/II-fold pyridoxal phosphate-dependent enzyme [Polaribacter sargassicola]|uniref:aminotransferase class I/II-fold pyridoxal phosphate-dependent enzyme n=1 Tax=Polaribacter sargassicola TaxID=2836891 RepID=UPI001F000F44|nr:aminotransferase class I/II-fold pyridoxal phosphate-dependent enzyme [Polaribacter sp. DS7-9]MCG1037359.1 aminotransferase class I/II-fold pyridoxal phosphate-dependent enzyme [Polaribacter sp. DS7-9]